MCELQQPLAGGYDFIKGHPKLGEYMERVAARTEPYFTEACKRIEFIKEKVAEGKRGPDVVPTDPNIV